MNICHQYSVTWRYEFNHLKSGVVTFGEAKYVHSRLLTEREWLLGETTVNELCEYKNLGGLKNYIGAFFSNVEDDNEKTRKKAGMIISNFGGKHVCLVYYLEPNFFFKSEPNW